MMSVYFIDLEAYVDGCNNYIIKELCIMDTCDILQPLHYVYKPNLLWNALSPKSRITNIFLIRHRHGLSWNEGCGIFDVDNIMDKLPSFSTSLYYVKDRIDGQKIKTLKYYFPGLRIVNYSVSSNDLTTVSNNITCPWRDHGQYCAYIKCLQLCVHYLSCK